MEIGSVIAVSVSKEKGTKKVNVEEAEFTKEFGIVGDAHAGKWHRQVSLLAIESINKIKQKLPDIVPGNFAENITTEGINLVLLGIGKKIKLGEDVLLEITQIGKECHARCEIFRLVGDCVTPKEGVFAKVLKGGKVKAGSKIEVIVT